MSSTVDLSPDKLAEGLVVGEGAVVFLSKDMVNVLHAPGLQQLGRAFRLRMNQGMQFNRNHLQNICFVSESEPLTT